MNHQIDRLRSLLEYAKHTAQIKKNHATQINQHKEFVAHEEKIASLPGVTVDIQTEDGEGDVWIRVARLHESRPPEVDGRFIKHCMNLSNSPEIKPSIKEYISHSLCTEFGLSVLKDEKEIVESDTTEHEDIKISETVEYTLIQSELNEYIADKWNAWAETEKIKRKSIRLYSDLFVLSQKLDGNLTNSPLEFVLGCGIAIATKSTEKIAYPVITQLLEIAINDEDMSINIRPTQTDPKCEVDAFEKFESSSVQKLAELTKEQFSRADTTFTPFNDATFENLLRTAATLLDSKGKYIPRELSAKKLSLPKPEEYLQIINSWVLFSRPRNSNLMIQDIERFQDLLSIDSDCKLSDAINSLVCDPLDTVEDEILTTFRGISSIFDNEQSNSNDRNINELYFPKPYNDEQVRIIQMLENHNGVVVQGPPGTGKTHTIANVICHYLALGKRVLVTSMKDPALAVLQEKIPESIRPLTVSLLTSESDGMRQFEFSIKKIASELTRINRDEYKQSIISLEDLINRTHSEIAAIDRESNDWAKKNLTAVVIDGVENKPLEIITEFRSTQGNSDCVIDEIGIDPECSLRATIGDIIDLRNARITVGESLDYVNERLPHPSTFPSVDFLTEIHESTKRLTALKTSENTSFINRNKTHSVDFEALSIQISSEIKEYNAVFEKIKSFDKFNYEGLYEYLRVKENSEIIEAFNGLLMDFSKQIDDKKSWIIRPIFAPQGIENDAEILQAINNLCAGKKPFGILGGFTKANLNRLIESIKIIDVTPSNTLDWEYVRNYLQSRATTASLLVRWNSFAAEIPIPMLQVAYDSLQQVKEFIELHSLSKSRILLEKKLCESITALFPLLANDANYRDENKLIAKATSLIGHYNECRSLEAKSAAIQDFKHPILGSQSRIANSIISLLSKIGSTELLEATLVQEWNLLIKELNQIKCLEGYFKTIKDVTEQIQLSGGIKTASRLRTEHCSGTNDSLIPDNFHTAWRQKRIECYVRSLDDDNKLAVAAKKRDLLVSKLAKLYQDVIEKRTWLKLAENATHSVRAALEAYQNAIRKIGKGTGIRASRYRQDARSAAEMANNAIPCWIMPHYRVSESLPSAFNCFDLVIIDEASQSDISALPAILRAKKILVVGDDKQVSPEGVGLEEEKIKKLIDLYLKNQVSIYRPQMTQDRSIYDLFKVVFAKSSIMLREHFRCVAPIIEYSKREFYNHELKPLRIPRNSERIDPPLVDVLVQDGARVGDVNHAEATFITEEIKQIIINPCFANKSIGIVSLVGNEQALFIMKKLTSEVGEELISKHKITCGDARTFQGKERDIMFLTMVASANNCHASTQDMIAQRYNVAASRARDRMYLVRSVTLDDLSSKDTLRRGLIEHFQSPFNQNEEMVSNLRNLCESPFETEVYDLLTERGFKVTPQVKAGTYRIDMVVEGEADTRLAIECDGDKYHGPSQWEHDMRRQRILERAGWKFWRCFASSFALRKDEVVNNLLQTLKEHGIEPTDLSVKSESIHTAFRVYKANSELDASDDSVLTEDSVLA